MFFLFTGTFTIEAVASIFGLAVAGILSQLSANARAASLNERISKLSKELSVASSRIESVSEEIRVTIDESNSYSDHLFKETGRMNDLTTHAREIITEAVEENQKPVAAFRRHRHNGIGNGGNQQGIRKKRSDTA